MAGKLILIPNILSEDGFGVLPNYLKEHIESCELFIVEHEKIARKVLLGFGLKHRINEAQWEIFNKKGDSPMTWMEWLQPALEGKNVGIISDAGCPGIADPGADVVKMAHELGIQVLPLVGPSSITMGLMASGLNGQSFTFWGYLPIETPQKIKRLKELEKLSRQFNQTQIFIETPYRNDAFLKDLIKTLHPETQICVAANITSSKEYISTKSAKNWKGNLPQLNKIPTVFYILAK